MIATARYTVDCSHKAFEQALAAVILKGVKFYQVPWCDKKNAGEQDYYSTFSYPDRNHPELTKNIFWKMAAHCLAVSDHPHTALYIEMTGGKDAVRITDGWMKDYPDGGEGPRIRYDENAFSAEMKDRLKKIAKLALDREEGDW